MLLRNAEKVLCNTECSISFSNIPAVMCVWVNNAATLCISIECIPDRTGERNVFKDTVSGRYLREPVCLTTHPK